MKRNIIIGSAIVVIVAAGLWYFLTRPTLQDTVAFPYIAHQKPAIDPHLPSSNAMADKLDDVLFDGLFNLVATPSGVVFEDGLGEFVGIDDSNVVTIRLKRGMYWHDSYQAFVDGRKVTIEKKGSHEFSARDLAFTLKRIQSLGSLSPDYILVSQALPVMDFEGPDERNEIRFKFRGDRLWIESDIKEVLSFKMLPDNSEMNALTYTVGTTPYMKVPDYENIIRFFRTPGGAASMGKVFLMPYVDNSTFTTELRNGNINVLLETPFGSLSPILQDTEKFFEKSNVSSTFFAVLFNAERLSRAQRIELRRLLNNVTIMDRFFKVGTEQQRHIVDFKGNRDAYGDLLNDIVFPTSSYYVQDTIVERVHDPNPPDLAVLPDTVHIKACLNYGYREEYADLIDILNDPAVTKGRVKATAVQNDDIKRGDYDALLIAISGYRSNFLFDLYSIFLRDPDLETYRINLQTVADAKGNLIVSPNSFQANHNFFHLDAAAEPAEKNDIDNFLSDIYSFMSTHYVGDKQEYARRVTADENHMALGAWLFSLPSLAYFSTQFDSASVNLYGVASQLSTLKRWKEAPKQ
jgi:ABC-type transport system substrate-binding protein